MLIILVLTAVMISTAAAQSQPNRITFLFAINGFHDGSKFDKAADLAVDDKQNLVFVCDSGSGTVDAFSRQGIAKFQIGKQEKVESPTAIAFDRSGNLYVAVDNATKIYVLDRKNELVRVINVRSEAGDNTMIGRMTVGHNDSLYVTDVAGQRVLVFDKEGKLVLTFGASGSERGKFQSIEDIAVDRQDRIYVTDATGIPVQVFDKSGKFIYKFGARGPFDEDFVQPSGLTVDRFDQVWVVDSAAHRIKVFDRLGFFLTSFGDYGMGEGSLFYPTHVELDNLGRIYVLERGLRRLQVFTLERPFQPFDKP
ncbi:MAG: 6-bladed beta-propeller [Armatimonadetes bacterium]|nr:6-bladed beta-propeller [Armatimonadota bacterium]